MMNKYGLKREILIDILDKHNINDSDILLLLKTEIEIHDFYDDKRFMPELKSNIDRQWRQDFLKEEAKEHIKEGDVDFAYKNLFELIRAENPGLHGANIHKMHFINESDKVQHENYYKDGFICEKEKNIIMEIINAIEEKEKSNVIKTENQNTNNLTKNNQVFKEKSKHLVKSVLYSLIFGSTGFMLLMEFFKTKNVLYIIISIMMFLVTLLLLAPFYEDFLFERIIFAKKKTIDKLALNIAKQIELLYKILKKATTDSSKKNSKFLFLRIKDQNTARNCAIDNIGLFINRIIERTTIIGYELTTGWIISEQDGNELESKIIVKIDDCDIIKIEYNNELHIPEFDITLKQIEKIINCKYKKQVKINYITKDHSNTIKELKNNDYVQINLFNKVKRVVVFSTGDNKFDENGNYKTNNFRLNNKEIECLNWFINNVNIEDYKEEILKYCNNEYSAWSDNIQITEQDIENEINIYAIAINITENWKSNDGFVYPEISFYGDCKCDEEHGICIGFRDKKFLGIHSQDWTL